MRWDGFLWEKLNASKCVVIISENMYFLFFNQKKLLLKTDSSPFSIYQYFDETIHYDVHFRESIASKVTFENLAKPNN